MSIKNTKFQLTQSVNLNKTKNEQAKINCGILKKSKKYVTESTRTITHEASIHEIVRCCEKTVKSYENMLAPNKNNSFKATTIDTSQQQQYETIWQGINTECLPSFNEQNMLLSGCTTVNNFNKTLGQIKQLIQQMKENIRNDIEKKMDSEYKFLNHLQLVLIQTIINFSAKIENCHFPKHDITWKIVDKCMNDMVDQLREIANENSDESKANIYKQVLIAEENKKEKPDMKEQNKIEENCTILDINNINIKNKTFQEKEDVQEQSKCTGNTFNENWKSFNRILKENRNNNEQALSKSQNKNMDNISKTQITKGANIKKVTISSRIQLNPILQSKVNLMPLNASSSKLNREITGKKSIITTHSDKHINGIKQFQNNSRVEKSLSNFDLLLSKSEKKGVNPKSTTFLPARKSSLLFYQVNSIFENQHFEVRCKQNQNKNKSVEVPIKYRKPHIVESETTVSNLSTLKNVNIEKLRYKYCIKDNNQQKLKTTMYNTIDNNSNKELNNKEDKSTSSITVLHAKKLDLKKNRSFKQIMSLKSKKQSLHSKIVSDLEKRKDFLHSSRSTNSTLNEISDLSNTDENTNSVIPLFIPNDNINNVSVAITKKFKWDKKREKISKDSICLWIDNLCKSLLKFYKKKNNKNLKCNKSLHCEGTADEEELKAPSDDIPFFNFMQLLKYHSKFCCRSLNCDKCRYVLKGISRCREIRSETDLQLILQLGELQHDVGYCKSQHKLDLQIKVPRLRDLNANKSKQMSMKVPLNKGKIAMTVMPVKTNDKIVKKIMSIVELPKNILKLAYYAIYYLKYLILKIFSLSNYKCLNL